MKTAIVIGLGFGDEGKGLATDYLCQQYQNPLVVRFSGGHQAGHTVVSADGLRHVFSNLGSGTLSGAATFWSRHCTFYPSAFWSEYQALLVLGLSPDFYIDPLAPVTTPFEIYYNRLTEKSAQHGSCGVGFGATIARQESPYKLFVQDLLYPKIVNQKLKGIGRYYEQLCSGLFEADSLAEEISDYLSTLEKVIPYIHVIKEKDFFNHLQSVDAIIFEGSQGILLDMDHGFFPNVTRAHTSSRNAMRIIRNNKLPCPEMYYVTRAYQTRHGNGYLSNETLNPVYTPNPMETNQFNEWQGHQRISMLDINMLQYALACDVQYTDAKHKHLIVTCMDQLNGPFTATLDEVNIIFEEVLALKPYLKEINGEVLASYSDCAKHMCGMLV